MVMVKNRDLFGSLETMAPIFSMKFPGLTKYRLTKFRRVYAKEYDAVAIVKKELMNANLIMDEKTKKNVIDPTKIDELNKEFGVVLDQEVDLNSYNITLSNFMDKDLSANDIDTLALFFEDDVEKVEKTKAIKKK